MERHCCSASVWVAAVVVVEVVSESLRESSCSAGSTVERQWSGLQWQPIWYRFVVAWSCSEELSAYLRSCSLGRHAARLLLWETRSTSAFILGALQPEISWQICKRTVPHACGSAAVTPSYQRAGPSVLPCCWKRNGAARRFESLMVNGVMWYNGVVAKS